MSPRGGRPNREPLVAMLRAVNVGGFGRLSMHDLANLCTALGFADVRTYIQSGNVVFRTSVDDRQATDRLTTGLRQRLGLETDVIVRRATALGQVLVRNPFPDAEPAKVAVVFSAARIDRTLFDGLEGPAGERVVAGTDELYVFYPEGQGRSKLKLPKMAAPTTVRNMNTVARLVAMCAETAETATGAGRRARLRRQD